MSPTGQATPEIRWMELGTRKDWSQDEGLAWGSELGLSLEVGSR
jgi:hypothetical protein